MKLKEGVSIVASVPEMDAADVVVEESYAAFGYELTITSGDERESKHHGKPVAGGTDDPHYEGKAHDYRLRNVPEVLRPALVETIAGRLECGPPFTSADGALVYSGPQYVVRWEYRGSEREHLHVQFGHVVV